MGLACCPSDQRLYLIGQVHHAQVGLHLEAEGGQGRAASPRPRELVEDDRIFRVQLFLLPVCHTHTHTHLNVFNVTLGACM